MNPKLRNALVVIGSLLAGGALNMFLITLSGKVIPPPDGADLTTVEGLKASMHLMQPKHFVFPFLAHALGTFLSAFLIARFAASRHMRLALLAGVLFLIGGVVNIIMLPSPLWFTLLDVIMAYIPMAYLGWKLGMRKA
jgi:hypothetical protein